MMGNVIDDYGKYAGKIWETLNRHGPLNETKILKATGLKKHDFYVAIGWLAKENKIFYNENYYGLGNGNWDDTIGINAGKVWQVLNECQEIDDSHLLQFTGIPQKHTYYAIGWLAKEGKIQAKKTTPKKPKTKFSLK